MQRNLRIYFDNQQNKEKIKYPMMMLVRRAIECTLEFEDFHRDAQVSVTFTDNEGIRELNDRFRHIDKDTDVLSFPMISDDDQITIGAINLGDIVISIEKTREQGDVYGHGFARELAFLCIHSTLHLLGYDHELSDEDDIDMRKRQSAIADAMGLGVKGEVK